MGLPKHISDEIDASSKRVSEMSLEERERLRWAATKVMYRLNNLPDGVNPMRSKKYRRLSRRNRLWNEKHQKWCRKDRQRKGLNPAKKAREWFRKSIPYR